MDLPDEAIEAGFQMLRAPLDLPYRPNETFHGLTSDEIGHALVKSILAAALPAIRRHIADEIEAIPRRTDFQVTCRDAHNAALAKAARVARGADS